MRYETILFILADRSKTVCSRICEQKMYEQKSRNFYLAAVRPNNARAARSMTETFLNRLSIADRCPLSLHKQRKSEHFLTAASCHERTKCTVANRHVHSITSSARASNVGGISIPSERAVCRLRVNSNLVDCRTGRSAGLAPLTMLP